MNTQKRSGTIFFLFLLGRELLEVDGCKGGLDGRMRRCSFVTIELINAVYLYVLYIWYLHELGSLLCGESIICPLSLGLTPCLLGASTRDI